MPFDSKKTGGVMPLDANKEKTAKSAANTAVGKAAAKKPAAKKAATTGKAATTAAKKSAPDALKATKKADTVKKGVGRVAAPAKSRPGTAASAKKNATAANAAKEPAKKTTTSKTVSKPAAKKAAASTAAKNVGEKAQASTKPAKKAPPQRPRAEKSAGLEPKQKQAQAGATPNKAAHGEMDAARSAFLVSLQQDAAVQKKRKVAVGNTNATETAKEKNAQSALAAPSGVAKPVVTKGGKVPPPPHKPQKVKQKRAKKRRLSASDKMMNSMGKTKAGSFVGDIFYSLGFFAECHMVRIMRVLREFCVLLGQMLVWLFGGLFRGIGNALKKFGRDITAPFRRLNRGFANMRKVMADERKSGSGKGVKKALGYFGIGVKNHAHLLVHLAGFILPLIALVMFGFTIYSLLNIEYALAVKMDGKLIGYIEDQSVLEDAKSMLRGRLKLSSDQDRVTWQFNPELLIGRGSQFTTKKQLVNAILKDAEFDITQATGLYIEGELYAVTTEGEQLQKFLNSKLKEVEATANPEAKVEFVREMEYDPDTDDVFLKSSIMEYDDLVKKLSVEEKQEKWHTVEEGETLNEVAHENNVQFRTLQVLNPQLEERDSDDTLEAGERLLVQKARPFLEVKTTERHSREAAIAFTKVETETEDLNKGSRDVQQKGVDGVQEIWEDFTYVDGLLISTATVDELNKVLQPPQDEISRVGTYEFSYGASVTGKFRPGAYVNPVPASVRSSRGMVSGHRGRDINAPTGTPIYAANAGTVITATTHYSYGNYVVIQHPDGMKTLYAHCSELLVTAGQEIGQGKVIALVGSTGNSSGPHCHLEFEAPGGGLLNPDNYVTGRW